ncbi:hypothetical protein PGT21_012559 [Puccinia graminis f. sp. tritici]|uniref:Uncharacterized protein n=1 Tax=Puccinia graminis f. sp. tritici TaxID=56615 RepID=A0A5B0N3Z5_PUCGR|nr:hypothetical protein PGTUg99_014200 [Puccinia graminis f. sp. tritici]KAA1083955.1 hypothetical protein PGT21_012559 [Puccinia graminis f. sp. tritici]
MGDHDHATQDQILAGLREAAPLLSRSCPTRSFFALGTHSHSFVHPPSQSVPK